MLKQCAAGAAFLSITALVVVPNLANTATSSQAVGGVVSNSSGQASAAGAVVDRTLNLSLGLAY